jgi:hypothetical protein
MLRVESQDMMSLDTSSVLESRDFEVCLIYYNWGIKAKQKVDSSQLIDESLHLDNDKTIAVKSPKLSTYIKSLYFKS